MKKGYWIGTALLGLAGTLPVRAQESPVWVETRFERVHLANGNFIDGHLIQESEKLLTFRIVGGDIGIRKDMVERNNSGKLWIELMRMRSIKEAPPLQPTIKPNAPMAPESAKTAPPSVAAPEALSEAVELKGTPAEQLEQGKAILKENSLPRQKGAIEALGRVGGPAAAFLVELMPEAKNELLPTIAAALQVRQEPTVLPQVRLLLHHERPAVREAAVLVVGAMGSPKEDGDGVRSLLSDSQVPVRAAALVAVRQLGDVDAFDAVAEFLLDSDSGMRLKAIVTLSELSQKGSLGSKLAETFAKYLSQASDQARMDLIVESAKLGAKELGPVLSKLTSDNDPMIRSHAIMGLTKINSPEYGPRILELLAIEREYWPRIQLAGAVQVMRLDAGIDPLIEWLSDQDSNIRSASLRALRALSQMNFGGDRANWEEWRAKTRRQ